MAQRDAALLHDDLGKDVVIRGLESARGAALNGHTATCLELLPAAKSESIALTRIDSEPSLTRECVDARLRLRLHESVEGFGALVDIKAKNTLRLEPAKRTRGRVAADEMRFSESDDKLIEEHFATPGTRPKGSAALLFPGRDIKDRHVGQRLFELRRWDEIRRKRTVSCIENGWWPNALERNGPHAARKYLKSNPDRSLLPRVAERPPSRATRG